jgi:hypothetical protein
MLTSFPSVHNLPTRGRAADIFTVVDTLSLKSIPY